MRNTNLVSLPQVELCPMEGPLDLFGAQFEPMPVIHGETEIYGFRFGSGGVSHRPQRDT